MSLGDVQDAGAARPEGAGAPGPEKNAWPFSPGRRVVFLLDAASALERDVLRRWIDGNRPEAVDPAAIDVLPIPCSRRPKRRARIDPAIEASLLADDDPWLAPLRIAWMPPPEPDSRAARVARVLAFGDPRDPGRLRQSVMLRRRPDCCRVVVAEPAPLSELRARWARLSGADQTQTTGLVEFIVRQAVLALERAERKLRGARYKVPKFVHEEILARPAFRGGISRLARALGKSPAAVAHEAAKDLREIAATHSPYVIDLTARLIRLLYTRAYGERLHYDPSRLREIYALAQRHPVVFLPSHKSNLDHLVLQYALHENGHPPNHTAGGINMNFFPVGPLVRRSGVFFIRRTFKDDEVYKFVLRQYIDFLIEKRFPLEWYIEGGRSRSGKLLPPRFGLLAYVVDAWRRGRAEDVHLIPVSIAYDQIQDVRSYAAEQRGAAKKRESFGWFLGVIRGLSHRFGDIHIRFGEPISLARALGPSESSAEPTDGEQSLAIQKVAFEVAVRINRETPITPTSLVTLALLGVGDRAMTVEEIATVLRNWISYVARRRLPTTERLALDTPEGVRRALDALVENGIVSCFDEGPEAVYRIEPEQQLAAAYYRNTIIHFFVNGAIAELALLRAAEEDVTNAPETFWAEAMRLRDLLKFEFFFSGKETFREELRREIALHDSEWEGRLDGGPAEIARLVRRFHPFSAHRVLRPFLEAYQVLADALARSGEGDPDKEKLLAACLGLGKQYHLQRRIRSTESVSKVLFETALRIARNRELLGGEVATGARQAFAAEIRNANRRIDAIEALAASRRAGLLD